MPVMEMSSQEAAAAIKMNARAAPFEAQPPKQTQHLRQRSRRSERGPMVEVNVFELAFRREVVRQRLAAQQELLLREQEFFQQQQQQQQQQHLPQQHQQQYRLQFELQQHLEQQQQQEQQQCAPETSRMETLPLHQTEAAIAYAQFGMPQKSLVELQQAHLEQQRQQLQLQLKREQAQELFAARAALHAQHQHQQQQLHQQSRAAYYNANNNAGMHRNAWGGSGRDEAGWEQQDVQNANLNAHPLVPPPCDDNDDEHDDGYDAEDDEPTGMDDDDLPPLDPNSVAGQRVALASGCLVELQQFLLLMLAVWNRSSQSGATDNPVSAIEIAAAVEHDAVMSVVHLADHLPVEFSISAPSAMPLEDLEALVARHFQSCSGNSAVVAMLNQMKAGAPRLLLSTQGSHVVLTLRIASPKACQLDSEVIYRVPQQTRTLRQQHDDICTVTRMAQLYSVFSNTTAPNVTCTVQVYHELDVAHAAFVDRIAVRIQGIFVGVVDRSQMNEKTRVLFSCSEVPQGSFALVDVIISKTLVESLVTACDLLGLLKNPLSADRILAPQIAPAAVRERSRRRMSDIPLGGLPSSVKALPHFVPSIANSISNILRMSSNLNFQNDCKQALQANSFFSIPDKLRSAMDNLLTVRGTKRRQSRRDSRTHVGAK